MNISLCYANYRYANCGTAAFARVISLIFRMVPYGPQWELGLLGQQLLRLFSARHGSKEVQNNIDKSNNMPIFCSLKYDLNQ